MKKLLNTLYVTTPGAYISKDGTNVVVSVDSNEVFRIPIQNIGHIATFGYNGASPGVMKLCVDSNVGISFFTPNGRFIAKVTGPVNGNVLLRCRQHEFFRLPDNKLHLSAITIGAKIYNSRVTLRRFVRDHSDRDGASMVDNASGKLRRLCWLTSTAGDLEVLRGIEGEAASIYFGAMRWLILNDSVEFKFTKRQKHPPTDVVNAMLSFGYSLLASECASALEGVGLDPAIGFMHTLRPGRNSLALDLMEELRSYLVDRLVLSLINNRQVSPSDFQIHEQDGRLSVLFTDTGRKTFLAAWQAKRKTEIMHPFLEEKVPLGLLPHIQAMLMARFLRNDIDDYPVFISK